jgi:hypothetical protein
MFHSVLDSYANINFSRRTPIQAVKLGKPKSLHPFPDTAVQHSWNLYVGGGSGITTE